VRCMAIKVCASNPEIQRSKFESASVCCLIRVRGGERGGGVAGIKANIFGKCGNGNIRTRARQQPSGSRSGKHFSGPTSDIFSIPLSISRPKFPPRVCLSICHFCLEFLPFTLAPFSPSFLFIFSKCIFVVQFQTASAILFRLFYP